MVKTLKSLLKLKKFKNKPGYEIPRLAGIYSKFPDKVMISINRGSSSFRDYYWLDINTKKNDTCCKIPFN
jgi:hypothetical protein